MPLIQKIVRHRKLPNQRESSVGQESFRVGTLKGDRPQIVPEEGMVSSAAISLTGDSRRDPTSRLGATSTGCRSLISSPI